ncbi:MAG: nitrous oxide reductase accessory protein NosL [Ignavibacteriaceae bacterium]|nr:nitrous oxide reductase accessory protein NosL [Ignavibacteriaceae bacterium]
MRKLVIALFAIVIAGCSSGPEKINVDLDTCAYCEMKISDSRFASQLITSKGKVFKFDDHSCMVEFQKETETATDARLYVAGFDAKGEWLDVNEAFFAYGEEVRSPMRGNAAAFKSEREALEMASRVKGEVIKWAELVKKSE